MTDRKYKVADFRRHMYYAMIALEKLQDHEESTRLQYNAYHNIWDQMNHIKELVQDLEERRTDDT